MSVSKYLRGTMGMLLATSAVLGACSAGVDGDEPALEGEELGAQSQEIIGGTIDAAATAHGHTVRINNNCTGTLLRNDVVLTARHCFSPPYNPSSYSIHSGFNGTTFTESADVLSIDFLERADCTWCNPNWGNDDVDVAVLHLKTPLTMDGATQGAFRSLYPFENDNLPGKSVRCEGWGRSTCTTGFGKLRYFDTTVDRVQDDDRNGRYYINPNAAGQKIIQGDSGGSCWLYNDESTSHRYVFGVNKGAGCGLDDTTSMQLNTTVRPWLRAKLGEYADNFVTHFSNPGELSLWTVHDAAANTGGPSHWTISGDSLRQSVNMGGVAPSVSGSGTQIIRNDQVIANAQIETKIRSNDNDSAGLVFRYVDENNYYRLVVNESAGGTVRFERVRRGEVTAFGVKTNVGIDWSQGVRVTVQSRARDHWAFINGQQVSYMFDKALPDGRVGVYNRFMNDVAYEFFTVSHLTGVFPEEN